MDKFLDTCTLSSLNQEKPETLNRPTTGAEVEAAIKSLPTKKKPRSRWVHSWILPDIQRGAGTTPSETIPNIQKEGILINSFYMASTILIPKPGRNTTKKDNFRAISLRDINAKILKKYWQIKLRTSSKSLFRIIKLDSSIVCKAGSTYATQ